MGSYLGQNFLINKEKIKEIVEALGLKSGDVVVEIGPGHGELTEEIVKIDKRLTTYDQRQGIEESEGETAKYPGSRVPKDSKAAYGVDAITTGQANQTQIRQLAEQNYKKNGKVKGIRIIAIEKDKELAENLSKNFQFEIFNFESISDFQISSDKAIIVGDALEILPAIIQDSRFKIHGYKIVGNIPYYITGYLFRVLGELENIPELIVMMIQKEVAERVAAKPPKNNLLAASVQVWADVEILSYVLKKDFNPIPEVDSAIIKLSPQKNADLNAEQRRKYYEFIKILFKQPRKTILNNIEESIKSTKNEFKQNYEIGKGEIAKKKRKVKSKEEVIKILQKMGINPQDRPQDLSTEKIIELSKVF